MVDQQVTADGHGQRPGRHPEQAGDQLAPARAGRAGRDHGERLVRARFGHAEVGRERGASRRLGRAAWIRHVDRREWTRLHQAASRCGDRARPGRGELSPAGMSEEYGCRPSDTEHIRYSRVIARLLNFTA
ncbi:hypothetical protein GCM10027186_29540 [Micromonospora schwarzwaldensis]